MKRMHYLLVASILFIALFSNTWTKNESPSINTDLKITKEERPTETFNAITIDDYISIEDSSAEQKQLAAFYKQRNYIPVWFTDGRLNEYGRDLVDALENAEEEALFPGYYSVPVIKSLINTMELSEDSALLLNIVRLDLMLTHAYFNYASDIYIGRVNPRDLNVVWEAHHKERNFSEHLEATLKNNNLKQSLIDMRPKHRQYKLLIDAYKNLLAYKNESFWVLPGNDIPVLEKNDSVAEVLILKQSLFSSGYLKENDSAYMNSAVFDNRLMHAVENFQRDHGLKIDGIVGESTLREMNYSIEDRLEQIRLNIDRLRWLPDSMGRRDIVVNIPDFTLKYFEDNEVVQEMGVIVGKTTNYTPALKDTITHIVFNPTWNVPWSIATEEMLPRIKTDSTYLSRNNYKLVRGSYASEIVVDPNSVDWSKITANNFPFSIIQLPGSTNALGLVKFMLPNNHAIYLHDTPSDHLFSRTERNFSHGCVRLERPFQLAETILHGQLTQQEIQEILVSRKTRSIALNEPVAVHLIYRTTWVDDQGQLQFRKDLYGFDSLSMPFLNRIVRPL